MFGRLLQSQHQNVDAQLLELQRDLKSKIDRAKALAHDLDVSQTINDSSLTTIATGEFAYPEFRANVKYRDQFWKTYLKNELSCAMIQQLTQRIEELKSKIQDIEALQEDYFRLYKLKSRKKNRRLAVQIDKKFQCPYEKCYKFYGSDVSLNLHIKIKHNGGNKTDREKLAEEICLAEMNQQCYPEMRFNLPPGFVEEYKSKTFSKRLNGVSEDILQQN